MKSTRCHTVLKLAGGVASCLLLLALGAHAQETDAAKTPAYEIWDSARLQMSELAQGALTAFETARSLSENAPISDKIECE